MSKSSDLVVILLLQFDLGLLELVDLVANHLHFLDLGANLAFDLIGASALVLELCSELFKNPWRKKYEALNRGDKR